MEGLWTYSEDRDGGYWVDLEVGVLIVRGRSGRILALDTLRAGSDVFFWRVVVWSMEGSWEGWGDHGGL